MSLDDRFGVLREPAEVNDWEKGVAPVSRAVFDASTASALVALREAAGDGLIRHTLSFHRFIWAIDEGGQLIIAVEELAPRKDIERRGYPFLHGFRHEATVQKLGHPTLLNGGLARIAGLLLLDGDDDQPPVWIINVHSGRYCRKNPPKADKIRNVAAMLQEFGLEVEVDDL